ncbi:MAG: preprotein translocase subunit YajC [Phycisphaeraceae bacterium]|nr:preprotein translocase subunit YajC [Phycisphaeraceae bacterium]
MFENIPLILAQEAPSVGGGDAGVATGAVGPGASASPAMDGQGPTMITGEAAPGTTSQPAAGAQPQPSPWGMWLPIILVFVVFYFLLIVPQRREKKKRAELLAAVKKGDRVQTVGGMIGTVMDLRPNDVLLKVDENTNTRIRFSRSAIQAVLSAEE